jgi:Fic family protein
MLWNWQRADWPCFTYDRQALEPLERQFLLRAGKIVGVLRHVDPDARQSFRIELIGDEALTTSAIEGEVLDRDSLQSSLRQQFGLETVGTRRIPPAERGIAEMMVDAYRHFADPLDHGMLHAWHAMVMAGHHNVEVVGSYRQHAEPMQVVSGGAGQPRVHFEAPPSARVEQEMDGFIAWFNGSSPQGTAPLPALTRAGIAHLYFESIHPYEDGNGRIGRALSEKALAQSLGEPTLIALAYTIERHRKAYYEMLEAGSRDNAITPWLIYFADTVLEAQHTTFARIEFSLAKARFYDRLRGLLNERQQKVLARMFRAGIGGFTGGLSAENYIAVTNASRATATRDLQDLVAKGALTRRGERRHTRYELNIER